jgi:TRAP-type C4-dicarboxylate transport system substrate-binding protein
MLVVILWGFTGVVPVHAQTLKIATIAPEGSSWMKDLRAGADEIQHRSNGRVSFKFYGGGVQGNDKQVQRKMRSGQLHGGAFTSGSMSNFQKNADLYALPMMFNDADEVMYVRKKLDPVLRQQMEDAGYVNFGFAGGGFAYMMSNRPLRSLADLSGQKVWTPEGDEISYAALKALGVAPVTMPLTDVMTGLQTDLLNSVTVSPVGAVVLQWHTRLKYITDLPVAYVYAAILIERKAFDRIPPQDQTLVREVMERIYRQFDGKSMADNDHALQALQESGLQLVKPEQAEVQSWREIVTHSHREQAQARVFDLALLDQLQGLLDDYRNGKERLKAVNQP